MCGNAWSMSLNVKSGRVLYGQLQFLLQLVVVDIGGQVYAVEAVGGGRVALDANLPNSLQCRSGLAA